MMYFNDLNMKTTPSEVSPSSRPRGRGQGPASIYVPPPLRKRKNSTDSKTNSQNISPQKSKLLPGRDISLNLNNPSCKSYSHSKKCENSYMLFGLENKSSTVAPERHDTSSKLYGNESKESCVAKECPNIKKCDNSYLLFASHSNDIKPEYSNTASKKKHIERQTRKQIPDGKEELVEPLTSDSNSTTTLSNKGQFGSWKNKNDIGIEPFESVISTMAPEELSFGFDSLSFANNISKNTCVKKCCNLKPLKQSSQRKCDNSSLLFDDCDAYVEEVESSLQDRPVPSTAQPLAADVSLSPSSSDPTISKNDAMSIISIDPPVVIQSKESLEIENKFENSAFDEDQSLSNNTAENVSNPGVEVSDSIEDYAVEIYDFPKSFRTQDIMTVFSSYIQHGFFVKWVDDTHALGIFSNPFSVTEVLNKTFDVVSIRHLHAGSAAALEAASSVPIPSASRPRTCPSLARRLVSGALGLKVLVPDEIRQAERKMLQEAKEERRLAARQREEAWEGTLRSNIGT